MKLDRRSFVRSTGIGLGFLPLLAADRPARAASGPKRLVLVTWPNGVVAGDFYPDCVRYDEKTRTYPPPGEDYAPDPASTATATSFSFLGRRMSEPLELVKQHLTLINGLGIRLLGSSSHEAWSALHTGEGPTRAVLGNPKATSLDQIVGDEIARRAPLPFKVLNTAAQNLQKTTTAFRAGQRVTPEEDPYRVFDTLFAGRAMDASAFERQRALRRSSLDFVGKRLEAFAQRLGSEDRQRVGLHLQSVREIERRLAEPVEAGGPAAAPPPLAGARFDPRRPETLDRTLRAHLELIAVALTADLTRVVNFQISDAYAADLITPWLGAEFAAANVREGAVGDMNAHHHLAHKQSLRYIQQTRWMLGELAWFIKRLADTPDPAGGSVLANSVVCIMSHMTRGASHMNDRLPTILAGTAGGHFRTGRYLKIPEKTNHAKLLVSLANAMDVGITAIGNPYNPPGPLTELR